MNADGTTLYSVVNTRDINNVITINSEIINISKWLKLNKLSLNVAKTKAMLFRSPQKLISYPVLNIDGHNIEFEKSFNYLGIVIDENLKCKIHIILIAKKNIYI